MRLRLKAENDMGLGISIMKRAIKRTAACWGSLSELVRSVGPWLLHIEMQRLKSIGVFPSEGVLSL